MSLLERFKQESSALIASRIQQLRDTLTFEQASSCAEVTPEDLVVAGKEVLLTTYRQSDTPMAGEVLLTVQVARHSLGGVASFQMERGLVFSRQGDPREATESELAGSRT